MKLRSHVVVLVMLTLLPMLALALVLIYWNARIQRQSVERSMQQTVAAMAYALDQELQATTAALQALAVSSGDVASDAQVLRARVEAVRGQHPGWGSVVLWADNGHTLIPLLQPGRAPVSNASSPAALEVMKTGQPQVSNLGKSLVLGTQATAIHVPLGGAQPANTLAAVIPSAHWVRFLQERLVPPGWVAGIIDRDGVVVARSRGAEQFVGKPAPAWVLEAIRQGEAGQHSGPAFEGQRLSLVFHRSQVSGWTVVFAAPSDAFEQPLRQALWTTLTAGLGIALAASALALLYARRIVQPITVLTHSATALGRFERLPQLPDTAVEEINSLYRTMARAGEDMAEAAVARFRAEEGERHAREMAQAAARQQALELSARQLEAASAMKSQFLANMSHEIRTPLNAILGTVQVLERGVQGEEHRRLVGNIRSAGRTLLELVNDVLDLARIESGHLDLGHSPFMLRDVLESVMAVLTPTAQAKGLALALRPVPEGLLRPLLGDARRLEQLLYNLVGNAIKFTDAGSVSVEVASLREQAAQVELQLVVRDTGIGIAADQIAHIFDAFVQADSSASRRHGGTGLGLAICREIATRMGGDIGVRSQPGVGSEFWLRLPFDTAVAPALSAQAPATECGSARLAGLRVLVVDDAQANLDIARRLLETEGAACLTATQGEGALQQLREAPAAVDVVLMDVQMPGLDGIECTQRLRADAGLARVPVIALTAGALAGQRERALVAGMNDFLAKPFELDALVSTILRWTGPRGPGVAAASPPAATPAGAEAGFPAIAGIDLRQAQQRFVGDRALFLRTLRALQEEFADASASVREHVQRGEAAQSAARMHKLRGIAGNLGAVALAEAAGQLEAALQGPQERTRLEERLQALDEALRPLLAAPVEAPGAVVPAGPVAPGTAGAAGAKEGDVAALIAALEAGDTIAVDRFEALRPALAGRHGAEVVKQLDRAVYGLRFQEARALLQAWTD